MIPLFLVGGLVLMGLSTLTLAFSVFHTNQNLKLVVQGFTYDLAPYFVESSRFMVAAMALLISGTSIIVAGLLLSLAGMG